MPWTSMSYGMFYPPHALIVLNTFILSLDSSFVLFSPFIEFYFVPLSSSFFCTLVFIFSVYSFQSTSLILLWS